MRMRRPDIRSLIGTVAVLGIAAMLAGPASAQQTVEARTGKIHEDCSGFGVSEVDRVVKMNAQCRTSDDNNDRAKTSISLTNEISANTETGELIFGGTAFNYSCNNIGVVKHQTGVRLEAGCLYIVECKRRSTTQGNCLVGTTGRKQATLELAGYLQVNDEGEIEVK